MITYFCSVNFPIFIFHELVIRLDQINPSIGRYKSHSVQNDSFILLTEKGSVIIPEHFLEMQFQDPNLINEIDIAILAHNFRLSNIGV